MMFTAHLLVLNLRQCEDDEDGSLHDDMLAGYSLALTRVLYIAMHDQSFHLAL